MAGYRVHYKPRTGLVKVIWLLVGLIIIGLAAGGYFGYKMYEKDLNPVSSDQTVTVFSVGSGATLRSIADKLQSDGLIKSAWAMELYVHGQKLSGSLEAGSYAFSPSMGTRNVVAILSKGRVSTQLITILPGRRIDQVRADLINDGFSPSDVDQALNPAQYTDLSIMQIVPANTTTLEGLLWPDSYQKDANTSLEAIIRESLEAMSAHLTSDITTGFKQNNLTDYQGITLASVVLQEVNKPTDQAQAAQVFLSRLKMGMMLGSDVTANYGSIVAGKSPDLTYDSPYNTLIHTGLPPTPISTVNSSALEAVAHPASTNWLYFVTGDDGTTYFSTNLQEHQALTQEYCHKLCGE